MIPVAFDLRDPDRSGIARVARSLARAFTRQFDSEYRVTLTGPLDTLEALGAREWGKDVRLVAWNGGRYSPAAELQWGRVRREVGESLWYFPHWDVPWHARPNRYAVMLHDLGHLVIDGVPRARRALARRWIHRSSAGAREITVGTQHTANEVSSMWPELATKIRVLPHGVDEKFFGDPAPLLKSIVERLAGGSFVLSVGIRKRHKNLSVGVEVLTRIPDLRWVVVGEWFPEWERVAQQAKAAGVADRIIVLERQTDESLHSLYGAAACLLFPSRYEGFGLPVLESLASGTPAVVSTAGASVEVLGGCGWVCDPDQPAQFVEAVSQALSLGARRAEYSQRCRSHARQFTWERDAARLADVFRRIA